MIFTERTITIRNDSSSINAPVILYRGDKNVEVRFTLVESPYKYSNRDSINIIESTDASYAQLVIKTPNGRDPIFGDITAVGQSNVIFMIGYDMIDEIEEVGTYDFQIRLFDADQTSMATIPEVTGGFIIKEPIAKEDSNNNITNSAIVGSAVVTSDVSIPTFVGGSYNKTAWDNGTVISRQKLDKIEDGIYESYELSKNNSSQIIKKVSKQELEVEKSRIDSIVALPPTVDNVETTDIRVGADGVTYDSAGNAVRSQISKINKTINTEVVKVKKGKNLYNPHDNVEKTLADGMVGSEQILNDSTTLLSQRIEIPYGKDITFYGVRSYSLVDKNNIITKTKKFIEVTSTQTLLWNELPSETKYIWICTYIVNSTTDTQVEIGTKKTEYESFGSIENTFECNGMNVPFVFKDDLKPIHDNLTNGTIGDLNGNILPLQNIEDGVFYSLDSSTNKIIRFENADYFAFTFDVENNRDYFIHSEHTINYIIILTDKYRNAISKVSIANSGTINTGTANKLIFSAKKYCLDDLVFSPDSLNKNSYYYKLPFIGVDENGRIAEILKNMNVLYGKKYYAYGDSYTELTDVPGVTYDRIIRKRNYMLGENGGISGSTMAVPNPEKTEGDHSAFSISRYLAIPEDADYVTLAFGINDSAVCDLGAIDDTTNTTFYGAWNVVLEWILTNRPYTKVGIIIFSRAYNTFYRAILEIADKWGIPVLDTFGGRNTSPTIDVRATEFNYSPTAQQIRSEHFRMEEHRLHPNSKAHEWNSTMIENFLRSL